jgi:hypothetical protein
MQALTYNQNRYQKKARHQTGDELFNKERFVYKPGSVTCEQAATIHLGLKSL